MWFGIYTRLSNLHPVGFCGGVVQPNSGPHIRPAFWSGKVWDFQLGCANDSLQGQECSDKVVSL